jgi:hypothetical protein
MLPNVWTLESLWRYPNLCRKLGLGIAFITVGSVACVSAITLIAADSDPGSAYALVPPERESGPVIIATTTPERPAVNTAAAEKTTAADPIPECQRNDASARAKSGCNTAAVHSDSQAMEDGSASPALPVAVPAPAVLLANAPPANESEPELTVAPSSPPNTPAPLAESAAAKPQKAQRRHSRQRNSYDVFPLFAFDRGRPRLRPLFW